MRILPRSILALLLGACSDAPPEQPPSSSDLCLGVVCNEPPADICRDAQTLLIYMATGICRPTDGEAKCDYPTSERTCALGCDVDRCTTGSQIASGRIVVREYESPFLSSEVEAYFAKEPLFQPYWDHRYDLRCTEVARHGDCALYESCLGIDRMCPTFCEWDQECDNQAFACRRVTEPWDVGTISIAGLAVPVTMMPDSYFRYVGGTLPADLFDASDVITASVSGGALEPFVLTTTGVADLTNDADIVSLVNGQSATIAWTPADPGTRIEVALESGWHPPNTILALIWCDAPDSAGQVEIAAPLVDGFISRSTMMNRHSYLKRYTNQVVSPFGGAIEIRIERVNLLSPTW